MDCPFCIKVCTKCKRILVAYNGNFPKNKTSKYGVKNECKECRAKYDKQYREENKENLAIKQKQYYEEHKEERSIKRKQYYEEHKEQELEKMKEYHEEHREEILEYQKQWYKEHKEEQKEYKAKYYEENKEKILENQKEYYEENKEIILNRNKIYREKHKEEIAKQQKKYREEHSKKIKEYYKQYYEEHKEEIKENVKLYNKENPHIRFNARNKRRQLEENQGKGITKEQWFEMMCWFDWKCAYSGEYIGGNNESRTVDHIVPLSKGGLNEIWNCVPMYANYNFSKYINNMEEWYRQQKFYSEERLINIYIWIEYAYEKWGKEDENIDE